MTANLRVQIARRADVLRVPNAALRFRPTTDMFAALKQPVPPELQPAGGRGRGRGGLAANVAPAETAPLAPGGRAGAGANGRSAASSGAASSSTPGGARPDGSGGAAPGAEAGRAGAAGGRGFGGGAGANDPDRAARMLDRFKSMSADEQQQFLSRMKERGIDTTPFEKAATPPAAPSKKPAGATKPGAPAAAETIDALFAPLAPVESQGRVWLAINKQLKPVRLRLGITDGTNTELISGDLQQNQDVVTGVVLPAGAATRPAGAQGAGNPLIPQQGRGGFRGR
jgi:hypothetical protein